MTGWMDVDDVVEVMLMSILLSALLTDLDVFDADDVADLRAVADVAAKRASGRQDEGREGT